jgi:hypothetical protein
MTATADCDTELTAEAVPAKPKAAAKPNLRKITTALIDPKPRVTPEELDLIKYFDHDHVDGNNVWRYRFVTPCNYVQISRHTRYRARINHYYPWGGAFTVDIAGRYDSEIKCGQQVVRYFRERHGDQWHLYANMDANAREAIVPFDDNDGEDDKPAKWMVRVYLNGRVTVLERPDNRKKGFVSPEAATAFGKRWVMSKYPLVWKITLNKSRVW